VFESLSLRTAGKRGRRAKGRLGWWRFIRRTKEPEIPVVLLEDSGALVGLGLAAVGVVLAALTDDSRFDAIGSIAIGLLLGAIATVLAVEMKSLLIGEGATAEQLAAIRAAILSGPAVEAAPELRTLQLGPGELLVAGSVRLADGLAWSDGADVLAEVERRVRQVVPSSVDLYLRPVANTSSVDDGRGRSHRDSM
jgi:divalent metal cation (Fe/Co/Zn/Cd) transporter